MTTTSKRLLQAHPMCCFCGGAEAAVNLDHQPARIMFPDKHRPKGLEFPACAACNGQTSPDEALVAFFARVTGNHRFPAGKADKALHNAIKAVARSFGGLLPQISHRVWITRNGIRRRMLALDGNNRQIEESVCRVAAKLALAAYYDHHGKAAPETVKINTMWTHNQNPHAAPGVAGILGMLPRERYLKQGKDWDTQDTFFIRYHVEGDAFFMVAILHESLALMAQITDAGHKDGWMAWHHVWSPVQAKGIQPFVSAV